MLNETFSVIFKHHDTVVRKVPICFCSISHTCSNFNFSLLIPPLSFVPNLCSPLFHGGGSCLLLFPTTAFSGFHQYWQFQPFDIDPDFRQLAELKLLTGSTMNNRERGVQNFKCITLHCVSVLQKKSEKARDKYYQYHCYLQSLEQQQLTYAIQMHFLLQSLTTLTF